MKRAFISRFSPNRTNPEYLEKIFVQRHQLAKVWFDRLRDGVLTARKHHLLAVGPRGSGKSHLVSILVHRLKNDPEVAARARIAWLPEDETTLSFWKFLLRILRALHSEYDPEFPPPPREGLENASDEHRAEFLTDYLLRKLDGRMLVVVVENLDALMKELKPEGQKRWRAFLQEHPVSTTLATAQQLSEDLSDRGAPFFNTFQVEHLKPLSADEALLLLRNLAGLGGDNDLTAFLNTSTGRARVRAIRHITGGSHRVFIILSEFATRENLDNLVLAFEELLDELTPYYQERLRWLPGQQREIVEFLCAQTRAVAVKEIASELYLSEQVAAAQLKSLRDKGYVLSNSVGRESRYELAEPLMRLCVEVKDPQREPIRLIVEFLCVWYDRPTLESRLDGCRYGSDMERLYYQAAFDAQKDGIPINVKDALERDLAEARTAGNPELLAAVLVDLALTCDSAWRVHAICNEMIELQHFEGLLTTCECAININPRDAIAHSNRGFALSELGRHEEALAAYDRAIDIDPRDESTHTNRGFALNELGRHEEAVAACDLAITIDPRDARAHSNRGFALSELGRHDEALATYERAIDIDPRNAILHLNRSYDLCELGRHADAILACETSIDLNSNSPLPWISLGWARLALAEPEAAQAAFQHANKLNCEPLKIHDGLAAMYIQFDSIEKLMKTLHTRFRLPLNKSNPHRSWYLHRVLLTLYRKALADRNRLAWLDQILAVAQEAKADMEETKAPDPMSMIGDALVRTLRDPIYTESPQEAVDAWERAWREAAGRYPDLSLAVRLFGVGLRYVRTKDERVLFDLLSEERAILRSLFRLDEET